MHSKFEITRFASTKSQLLDISMNNDSNCKCESRLLRWKSLLQWIAHNIKANWTRIPSIFSIWMGQTIFPLVVHWWWCRINDDIRYTYCTVQYSSNSSHYCTYTQQSEKQLIWTNKTDWIVRITHQLSQQLRSKCTVKRLHSSITFVLFVFNTTRFERFGHRRKSLIHLPFTRIDHKNLSQNSSQEAQ